MSEQHGKVIIITGGASGIGKETALQLSDQGATIIVADYNEEGAKNLHLILKQLAVQQELIGWMYPKGMRSKPWSSGP